MSNESKLVELPVPSPTSKAVAAAVSVNNGADVQALFADVTKMTPWDEEAKKAFLASKMHMVRTHPTLDLTARTRGRARLHRKQDRDDPHRLESDRVREGKGYRRTAPCALRKIARLGRELHLSFRRQFQRPILQPLKIKFAAP
jgi:hypothetical protein